MKKKSGYQKRQKEINILTIIVGDPCLSTHTHTEHENSRFIFEALV